jgi:hypothetical protein
MFQSYKNAETILAPQSTQQCRQEKPIIYYGSDDEERVGDEKIWSGWSVFASKYDPQI